MDSPPLPLGTYILNNGPRKKGQGGRFTMGTHRMLKQLMKDVPGVVFTEKPEKADFVILPEGVHEPGSKLTKRNPSLKDPRRVFSMDQIAHVMHSEAYARRKHGLMYTTKDTQGRDVRIDVPVNLEPSDQTFAQAIAKISGADIMVIPDQDYTVVRRNIRGAPQPVIVPTPPPTASAPPVFPPIPPASGPPLQQQQPRPIFAPAQQQQQQPYPPPPPPPATLWAKISQLDALLGTLQPAPAPIVLPPQPVFAGPPPQPQPQPQLQPPTPPVAPHSLLAGAPLPVPSAPRGNLPVDVAAVQKAYTELQRNPVLTSNEPEPLAELFDARESNSLHILKFIHQLEKLRQSITTLLYGLQIERLEERYTVVQTQAEKSLPDIGTSWKLLSTYLPALIGRLATFQPFNPAQMTDTETTTNGLLEANAYLNRFIALLAQRNTIYREQILKDLRASQASLHCQGTNLVCDAQEPEDLRAVLGALFNAACEIVQTSSRQFTTEIAYQNLCKITENVHATLCDIYNFFHLRGIRQEGWMNPTDKGLCNDFYKALSAALNNYHKGFPANQPPDDINIVQALRHLQTLSLQKDGTFWSNAQQKPTLYNWFYRFLLRLNPVDGQPASDRVSTFSELQATLASSPGLNDGQRQRLYGEMMMTALFFCLANFCSGSNGKFLGFFASGTGDFSVKTIQTLLKTNYIHQQEDTLPALEMTKQEKAD